MMEYKGYIGKAEFDDEAGVFYGEIIGLRDVVTFRVSTVKNCKNHSGKGLSLKNGKGSRPGFQPPNEVIRKLPRSIRCEPTLW